MRRSICQRRTILSWGRRGGWSRRCLAGPDQHFAIFVDSQSLGRNDLVLEPRDIVVMQIEPSFQCPIRYSPLAAEQIKYLVEDVVKCHQRPPGTL
jgi:hypothetical protein